MKSGVWGEQYRTTIICVDSYEDGIVHGRIYNLYMKGGQRFSGLTQCILKVEEIMDSMSFPKAGNTTREFVTQPQGMKVDRAVTYRKGELATFAVRVMFRQNASWQGTVAWVEGKQKQAFRSVLQLLHLIGNVLNYEIAS